jgi:hypothetical protein
VTVTTVDEYLEALPEDRRIALGVVRDTINANLPDGYEEGILYNIPCWYVPLDRYSDTYNKLPVGIAGFASQKNYMALYMMTVYSDPAIEKWFKAEYKKAGKKLDMGKSCVRFKKLDDLALDVIAETIAKVPVEQLIESYESVKKAEGKPKDTRAVRAANHKTAKKKSAKKPTAKRPKSTAKKKSSAKKKTKKR